MIRSAPSVVPIAFLEHAMASHDHSLQQENDRLVGELERTEAYEQRLRQYFADIRTELAAGHPATALSLLNEALSFIDDATDVVAPHAGGPPSPRA